MFKDKEPAAWVQSVEQNHYKVVEPAGEVPVYRLLIWPIDCFDLNALGSLVRDDDDIPSFLCFSVS